MAKELNPNFQIEYLTIEIIANLMLKDWSKAKEVATLAVERLPESVNSLVMLILADVKLGNMEDAIWNLEELFILNPKFQFNDWKFGNFNFLSRIAAETKIKISDYQN